MSEEKVKIRIALIIATAFTVLLWLVKIFELLSKIDIYFLGVYPRSITGLFKIITSPLIHSDFSHLISNTSAIFVLLFFLFYVYFRTALKVFLIIYFMQGLIVWSIGRSAYHIGSSGLIYGFATYLFFMGAFRKDSSSIAVALLVTFLYGGIIWGVLPVDPHISFEAHLAGALVGLICAIVFRKSEPLPVKYEWEEESDDEDMTQLPENNWEMLNSKNKDEKKTS
ncbi:MAG: rhomboid family intramembrane serine protease [Ignavibacteria bacterium]